MSHISDASQVIPAHVGFLAIFNPSLGTDDATLHQQIVYYHTHGQSRHERGDLGDEAERQLRNEQLRQIGLAQGMVDFARNFSQGAAVETVETEKARIVMHQLESGWWLLASVNLTAVPKSAQAQALAREQGQTDAPTMEYSSREMRPPVLLLQDLLQAHSTFLLHHASSLSALFVRTKRSKFVGLLTRYWDTFISSWNVLMHGNPLVDAYGAIKLAASGELGIGVGEEDRGSAERAALEGFTRDLEGLVDIYVAKFGDASDSTGTASTTTAKPAPWLGSGRLPQVDDGAIFLGTGALSRKSVQDISHWVQDLYRWGPQAYGVLDNPTSNRRPRRRRPRAPEKFDSTSSANDPPSLTPGATSRRPSASLSKSPERKAATMRHGIAPARAKRPSLNRRRSSHTSLDSDPAKSKKFMNFLKMGYGTHWSLGSAHVDSSQDDTTTTQDDSTDTQTAGPSKAITAQSMVTSAFQKSDSAGHFLIGLVGDLDKPETTSTVSDTDGEPRSDQDTRVHLRTLTVELEREEDARAEADISIDLGDTRSDAASSRYTANSGRTGTISAASYDSQDRNKAKKVRVVVYASKPFLFVFLFELRADSLAMTSLYRNLHTQLQPLIKPLLSSTRYRAPKEGPMTPTNADPAASAIYDLLYDPALLTVQATIPGIPGPTDTIPYPWTRLEALNTHIQLLSNYASTRKANSERERTCKTNRGWWIVWTRVQTSEDSTIAESGSDMTATLQARSSGQVKIPTLITEDSAETAINVAASFASGQPQHDTTPASERVETPPTRTPVGHSTGRSGGRQHQVHASGTSSVDRSIYSGPAHPDQERREREDRAIAHESAQRRQDKEIWLLRKASGIGARDDDGAGGVLGGSGATSIGFSALAGRLGALASGASSRAEDPGRDGSGGMTGKGIGMGIAVEHAGSPAREGDDIRGAGAAAGIASGIGVDTKRYIEGLLGVR